MILRSLHKGFSVSMAIALLVTTTSWTVDTHYCMGHVMDVSFFKSAETCGMMDSTDVGNTDSHTLSSESCCSDELIAFQGQDKLAFSCNDLQLEQQLFLAAFAFTYLNVFQEVSSKILPSTHYPPPNLVKDILVLDQVFLI